ncbi:MAG TPA: ScyD/ScyE family protein [Chloroflexota bacterium]|jgi:hypothetical protein|nr:ScyD/ScyE family protein [Chloroflexota bacterium]
MRSLKASIASRGRLAGVISSLLIVPAMVFGASAVPAAAAIHQASVKVVTANLNNPRNLTWGPNGELLVSEAGVGGPTCFGPKGNQTCLGLTGSIAAVKAGKATNVVQGLVSDNQGDGISGIKYANGHLYGVMSLSSAVIPAGLPPALAVAGYNQLGRLLQLDPGHAVSMVADPGDYDYAWSNLHKSIGAGNFPDANPYALLVKPHITYVVDAASNTLDSVTPDGTVSVLGHVPNPPKGDAVPTCIDQGKDGTIYIGQLTSAGNKAGVANIYRWTPKTGFKVWLSGFSAVTGCGFGANGDFYVTEFDLTGFPPAGIPAGAVVQVTPSGQRTVLGQGKLFAPNGFLADPHGPIYVTNWSVQPGTSVKGSPTGEVVKITP